MPLPNTKMKISNKNGVTFESNVDAVNYTLHELSRAALRDVAKFVKRETKKKIKKRTGRVAKNTQHWVKHKQKYPELEIGFKPGGFYGGFQEVGTSKVPKVSALYTSVAENIPTIIQIQSKYLSALNNIESAQSLIDESEEVGDD